MSKFGKAQKKEFIKLYAENDLHIGLTCDAIGINRITFYRAKDADEEFKEAIDNIEAKLDDILFGFIMQGIKEQDTRLAYLKLMSAQRIDKIMDRVKNKEISLLLDKDNITLD